MAYDDAIKIFSLVFHSLCLGLYALYTARIGFTHSAMLVSPGFPALFLMGHVYLLMLFIFSLGDWLLNLDQDYPLSQLLTNCLTNLRDCFLYLVLMRLSGIMEPLYSWFYIVRLASFIFLLLDTLLLWSLCISQFISAEYISIYYNYIMCHSIVGAIVFILLAGYSTWKISGAAKRLFLIALNLIAIGFFFRGFVNICDSLNDVIHKNAILALGLCSSIILPISYMLFMVALSQSVQRAEPPGLNAELNASQNSLIARLSGRT